MLNQTPSKMKDKKANQIIKEIHKANSLSEDLDDMWEKLFRIECLYLSDLEIEETASEALRKIEKLQDLILARGRKFATQQPS